MMNDADCVALLQWLLPRLHLRWQGYRRVRRQVCKRFRRRVAELGLEVAGRGRSRRAAEKNAANGMLERIAEL